jgi:cell division protein FtsQ
MAILSSAKLEQLKLQQKRQSYLALWRSAIAIGCTVGLLTVASLPYWQVRDSSQLTFEGENLIAEKTLYSWLAFAYPQSIWSIPTQKLTQKLESIPSIAAARITRQILPPRMTIEIQERIPVAIAETEGRVGFLDERGIWIDQKYYGELSDNLTLPALKVVNFQASQRNSWNEIYRLMRLYSAIKIEEITWDRSNSLFLKTEIGMIYLGSNPSQLEEQFAIMAKLKNLPERVEVGEIAYIDLSNPNLNLIQKYQK